MAVKGLVGCQSELARRFLVMHKKSRPLFVPCSHAQLQKSDTNKASFGRALSQGSFSPLSLFEELSRMLLAACRIPFPFVEASAAAGLPSIPMQELCSCPTDYSSSDFFGLAIAWSNFIVEKGERERHTRT